MKPKNPESVIAALRAAVGECPELRIGQIIANALPENFRSDPFYVDDDELADALLRYVERTRSNREAQRAAASVIGGAAPSPSPEGGEGGER